MMAKTPLHRAAYNGHQTVSTGSCSHRLLIAAGADVNQQDR